MRSYKTLTEKPFSLRAPQPLYRYLNYIEIQRTGFEIMQTFLPTKNFKKSAKMLDYRRLGKQRVEGMQLINSLSPDYSMKGWLNHPARLMWRGYENALKYYTNTMIKEWIARGYNNTMQLYEIEQPIVFPQWLGYPELHKSHRMNLLRKDYDFYKQHFDADAQTDLAIINEYEYYWPQEKK